MKEFFFCVHFLISFRSNYVKITFNGRRKCSINLNKHLIGFISNYLKGTGKDRNTAKN